nr:reverse transcriptase domain-containing protein [Tanacetum cinerariifolium]
MPTLRTAKVDLVGNNEALKINLDLVEERREEAAIREAKSKAKIKKYYSSKVRNTSFTPGDLVYRNNDPSRAKDTWKLGTKWEGPYEVTEALRKGAYKLRDCDGKNERNKACRDRSNGQGCGSINSGRITLKVLSVPVKAITDKGSDKGTKTSWSVDLCLAIFSLIL